MYKNLVFFVSVHIFLNLQFLHSESGKQLKFPTWLVCYRNFMKFDGIFCYLKCVLAFSEKSKIRVIVWPSNSKLLLQMELLLIKGIDSNSYVLWNSFLLFQLDKGSVNNYILSVPRCLGPIIYMRVWHDNAGPGDMADWYLDRIVLTDLAKNET